MRLAVTVVLLFAGPVDEPPTLPCYVLVDATLNDRALVGTIVLGHRLALVEIEAAVVQS